MNPPKHLISFDVESIGLNGEGFAVGWVVISEHTGGEVSSGRVACDPALARGEQSDRDWVRMNCPPIEATHATPRDVRDSFWSEMAAWIAQGGTVIVECGCPVEANFLADCIRDVPGRQGPYPLHDVATAMLAAGMDPMATYARDTLEMPKHDPLADARQSARLWREAMATIRELR